VRPDVILELGFVPRLDVNTARSSEATDQAFARFQATHGTAAGLFDFVVAAPSDEMAVVDNVRFAGLEIDSVHGTEACQPHDALAYHVVDEEILAAEESLADALGLGLLGDFRSASEEGIPADNPGRTAIDVESDDIAKEGGSESHTSRSVVGRLGHLAASKELLHGELDLTGQLDVSRHVNHGSRLGAHIGALLEGDVEDCVGIAVSDAVAAAGELAIVARVLLSHVLLLRSKMLLQLLLLLLLRRGRVLLRVVLLLVLLRGRRGTRRRSVMLLRVSLLVRHDGGDYIVE